MNQPTTPQHAARLAVEFMRVYPSLDLVFRDPVCAALYAVGYGAYDGTPEWTEAIEWIFG